MDPGRWAAVESLFARAFDLPGHEREGFLSQATEDEGLRAEVRSLLAHATRSSIAVSLGGPIARAAAALVGEPATGGLSLVGTRLGAYEITGVLGHGGMGAVYRARRADGQFEQEVAIKLVKEGLDSPGAFDRFVQERQILARLEHPWIARLLDAGTLLADGGRELPYIVMELVEGQPVTTWCEQRDLPLRARLELFREICAAVQHAHQQLIVHRDLKPANILVDGAGHPKLLDFGIARLLVDEPGRRARLTSSGMALLTPEYGSPEQVIGGPVTAATDVYALGAVLYELLTGVKAHVFEGDSVLEMVRVICEVEAPKPSVALRRSPRWTKRGQRALEGDLDTIVLKAMQKEPGRRYPTVAGLSEDVGRHLEGLPVRARPDTLRYRAWSFARRHAVGIAAVLAVIASLSGGIVVSVHEQRKAQQRLEEVRSLAAKVLFDLDPTIASQPGNIALRKVLVETATEYLDRMAEEAEGDPGLLEELAVGYLKTAQVWGGQEYPSLGQSEVALKNLARARALAEELVRVRGPDPATAYLLARIHITTGEALDLQGRRPEALVALREASRVAHEALAQAPTELRLLGPAVSADNRIGDLLAETGALTEAKEVFQRNLALLAALDDPRAQTGLLNTQGRMGGVLRAFGDLEGALAVFREGLRAAELALERPDAHPSLRDTRYHLLVDVALTLHGADMPNLGDAAGGQEAFDRAAQAIRDLSAAEPEAADYRRLRIELDLDRAASSAAEAPSAAVDAIDQALLLAGSELAEHPEDPDLHALRARGRSVLARALLELGREQAAVAMAALAVADQARFAEADPAIPARQDHLALARVTWAEALARTGAIEAAAEQGRLALGLAEALVSAAPERLQARYVRATVQERLGRLPPPVGGEALRAASRAEWQRWVDRGQAVAYARARLVASEADSRN